MEKYNIGSKIKFIEYDKNVLEGIVDEIIKCKNGKIIYHATPITEAKTPNLIGYIVNEDDILE